MGFRTVWSHGEAKWVALRAREWRVEMDGDSAQATVMECGRGSGLGDHFISRTG